MKDTLINSVEVLLKKNKISFDKEELWFQLKSHPSYPSLHAVTGVLDHFNIENIAAEISKDTTTLEQLPQAFIAQIKTASSKELVTVYRTTSTETYTVFHETKKTEKITISEFLKRFTGIIVAVEKNELKNDVNTTTFELKNYILIVLLLVLTVFLLISKGVGMVAQLHLLASLLGILLTYTILKQELRDTTLLGNAFCSGNDEKKGCDNILNSKGARITKSFKLSDISMVYFVGLAISSILNVNYQLLYLISLMALPVTIYSIYYQYRVAKSWCLLCISIVGILWFQGVISVLNFSFVAIKEISNVITILISLISAYLSWSFVKPLLSDVVKLKDQKIKLTKFKRNFEIFNSLLQKKTYYNTQINTTKEIVFGNLDSTLEIIIITNPFCGHCKMVHKQLETILERHKNNVKIRVRFNVNTTDKESKAVVITSRLLEIFNNEGTKTCLKALNEIYEENEPKSWLEKWGQCSSNETYVAVLAEEKNWCTNNGINFTPEILINGRSYPIEYDRTDLNYFIEDLYDNCS